MPPIEVIEDDTDTALLDEEEQGEGADDDGEGDDTVTGDEGDEGESGEDTVEGDDDTEGGTTDESDELTVHLGEEPEADALGEEGKAAPVSPTRRKTR
jgi:hypothetical protein